MSVDSPAMIFLHSMWRSRSTWIFQRFRASGRHTCFYEPLNERLARLTPEDLEPDEARRRGELEGMGHDGLEQGYWWEYATSLNAGKPGVRGFEPGFAYRPFGRRNDPGPYLRGLAEQAGDGGVVFKMCRSPFRLAALVERFPEARHVYLRRDAADQLRSYGVRPRFFLPAHLAYAWLQPALRPELADRFPSLRPAWPLPRGKGQESRLLRHFRVRLELGDDALRTSAFEFLHRAAFEDARSSGVEIVDVDDRDALRRAFAPCGVTFDEAEGAETGGQRLARAGTIEAGS